jgi:hypothetical protein
MKVLIHPNAQQHQLDVIDLYVEWLLSSNKQVLSTSCEIHKIHLDDIIGYHNNQ